MALPWEIKNNNEGSNKKWKDVAQWLINKNIVTMKDFYSDCEWKLLINNDSELLHAKENESVFKSHAKISENNRQRIYEHDKECNEIDQICAEVIGLLAQNKFRITDEDSNFAEREKE